jgi:hypothetical protein
METVALRRHVFLYLIAKMNDRFLEQQINIKFCVKLGKNMSDTSAVLSEAYGAEAMKMSSVFKWHKWFKESCKTVEGDKRHCLSLPLISGELFALNSFHKAKQSTKLIICKY